MENSDLVDYLIGVYRVVDSDEVFKLVGQDEELAQACNKVMQALALYVAHRCCTQHAHTK